MKKIPFDALCLAAVADEILSIQGAKVQGIRQPNDHTIVLELYSKGNVHQLLISCHPEFYRIHFTNRKPASTGQIPVLCATLRARLEGHNLEGVRMQHSDRVLVLDFGDHKLIAELMGKHSNLIFIDHANRVISAAKWVKESQSSRPILPNTTYQWPPVLDSSLPTLQKFTQPAVHSKFDKAGQPWSPGLSAAHGAYPVSLLEHYPSWLDKPTFSQALDEVYSTRIRDHELETLRATLTSQLQRAIEGRQAALNQLYETQETGGKATLWQRQAELLMAYAANLPSGSNHIKLPDYDGNELEIRLNSELSGKENALALFERAKKAKGRVNNIQDQILRLETLKSELNDALVQAQSATRKPELETIQSDVRAKRLLNPQQQHTKEGTTEKPYEGHRIRELIGPKNHRILYGENAEANDYLTLRVAKSNDWWLHVRGHTSAHVLVPTQNKPELTPREVLEFAAKVAVQQSAQKHAGYVSVDYVLKKHVRRTKGAPKGSVIYTHEKTLHVEA